MSKIPTAIVLVTLLVSGFVLRGWHRSIHAGVESTTSHPGGTGNLQQGFSELEVLDVRDHGVDCTFTRDSSPALNALTAAPLSNGYAIVFPPKCHVKIASTWLIKNLSAFTIRGLSGAGSNGFYGTNVPTLSWSGPAGGTMVDLEYVNGFVIENLAIDGAGLAGVAINVDKAGRGGTINTTDGILRRLNVNPNFTGLGRDGWTGLRFADVSTDNVEDMRVLDSSIRCQKTPNSRGILVGRSPNAKNFQILHNDISDCTLGIATSYGGSFDISFNEFSNDGTDINLGLVSDPTRISYNLSESEFAGQRFLNATQLFTNDGIELSGNHIAVNDVCALNINNAHVSMTADNTFYAGYRGSGPKLCNSDGKGNSATVTGLGGLGPGDLTSFLQQSAAGGVHNKIIGNTPVGWVSNAPEFVAQSGGGLLLTRAIFYSRNDSVDGFSNSNQLQNGLPCGLESSCEDEGSQEVTGVTSPEGLRCEVTGNETGTLHVYLISAVDAEGRETLLRGNGNAAICRGPAAFDETHYEILYWLPSANAVGYNLYAADPANQIRVNPIATGISSTSYRVRSYPRTFTITAQRNALNRTLSRVFRGKAVELQYGTPLEGFRDRGMTKTFVLSSDGLQLGSSGTLISQIKVYSTGQVKPLRVPSASCADQTFAVRGLTKADQISNIVPPATLGNVSLNGYVSTADTLLLHFCNPSSLPATPPSGTYSILAVR